MTLSLKIENLYKEYRLGVIGHGTLYRDLQSYLAKLRGKEDPNSKLGNIKNENNTKTFLALENINLEIEEGTVLGIIGHNGAGKSTLLKIISRITSPSRGDIKIRGRFASLLEVGTGFHPELTGRENIYLNGTINGMNKRDIDKKFEEIVDFAGVEKFIDTPIKRYSSGMIVRLGFAVAANIDPDILIVDEVLAVGDAQFQKKAINKIKDVNANKGKTVLFVSHNMNSIQNICNQTIILDKGKILDIGNTDKMISNYLNHLKVEDFNSSGLIEWSHENMPGNSKIKLSKFYSFDSKGEIKNQFDVSDEINISFEYFVKEDGDQIASIIEAFLSSNPDQVVLRTLSDYVEGDWGNQEKTKKGKYCATCKFPKNIFGEGGVLFSLRIFSPPYAANLSENVKIIKFFKINITDSFLPNTSRGSYPFDLGDSLRPKLKWITNKI